MAIRTLVSGAVPIFLETVTLPLLPRSAISITTSLFPASAVQSPAVEGSFNAAPNDPVYRV